MTAKSLAYFQQQVRRLPLPPDLPSMAITISDGVIEVDATTEDLKRIAAEFAVRGDIVAPSLIRAVQFLMDRVRMKSEGSRAERYLLAVKAAQQAEDNLGMADWHPVADSVKHVATMLREQTVNVIVADVKELDSRFRANLAAAKTRRGQASQAMKALAELRKIEPLPLPTGALDAVRASRAYWLDQYTLSSSIE